MSLQRPPAQLAPTRSMIPIYDKEAWALPLLPLGSTGEPMDICQIAEANVSHNFGRPMTAAHWPAAFRLDRTGDWRGMRLGRVDDVALKQILAGVEFFPFYSLACVTEAVAKALVWLDFGEGRLTEIPVYASDGNSLLPQPLFLMEYLTAKTPSCAT